MKGLAVFGIIISVLLIGAVIFYFSIQNEWVERKNQYQAQIDKNRAVFDEVWKVISQTAQVPAQYKEDFKDVYKTIMENRDYKGELMQMITESNPTFDSKLYSKIQEVIEIERVKFTASQEKAVSFHTELKNMKEKFPSSFILANKELPELIVVTSSKTEDIFKTEKEDDVDLFSNTKK